MCMCMKIYILYYVYIYIIYIIYNIYIYYIYYIIYILYYNFYITTIIYIQEDPQKVKGNKRKEMRGNESKRGKKEGRQEGMLKKKSNVCSYF